MRRSRIFAYAALALPALALALPHAAFGAALDPIVPQVGSACYCPGSAPDWGCILQVLQKVINAAVYVGVTLCVVWIAVAGFTLLTSGDNPEARSLGKTRALNAVIGIAVILCSWLIIDFVMKTVYEPSKAFEGGSFGPWNTILAPTGDDYCIKVTTPNALFTGTVNIISGGGTSAAVGGGTCTVQESGGCAVSNLQSFGAAAQQASQICHAESAGIVSRVSSTDRLGDGTPYSFGLFQINITANPVAGLNCPDAFSKKSCTLRSCGPGTGAHVVNARLYNECAAAAKNLNSNIAAAVSIYQKAGNSWRPWGTHTKCGLSLGSVRGLASAARCLFSST